ncbi:MAG: helix-turn-helix transcriptional regulator [Bacilli bacterium]|jgi:transcriptional regulator with XRE-family HTH domain|nr:helix-turn-helix transcriptional regulator [Bacilli bacterium]
MIGSILKNMRLSAGLSQKDLGKKLNLADTTISSYERENSQPDFDTIVKIADICGYEFRIIDQKKEITTLDKMSKEMDF